MTNPYGVADGGSPTPAPRWAPAPPPQWGPASTGSSTPVERRRRVSPKLAVAVAGPVVVVVALVAVLGLAWPGFLNKKVFDAAALQQGVLTVLRDDYQLDADLVACPSGRSVTVGSRFSCSAQVAGAPKTITVTVLSSDGRFEVGRPQ
ncbi:DUF4333 domain-containing protein [Micromonospora krabiensis]|uniref:DUF4333 domain-containing protein n=1 Tax=Micromonospora krabiensis TaxID=307121 RepID=A0A1C3N8Y4_9ACTN|nr:DUF4333 domain-containing protein [Micromonospora krabiensis]SBV29042.1 protein of unknown function [Micromonospora krabiensis]